MYGAMRLPSPLGKFRQKPMLFWVDHLVREIASSHAVIVKPIRIQISEALLNGNRRRVLLLALRVHL